MTLIWHLFFKSLLIWPSFEKKSEKTCVANCEMNEMRIMNKYAMKQQSVSVYFSVRVMIQGRIDGNLNVRLGGFFPLFNLMATLDYRAEFGQL